LHNRYCVKHSRLDQGRDASYQERVIIGQQSSPERGLVPVGDFVSPSAGGNAESNGSECKTELKGVLHNVFSLELKLALSE
jgi:hypothetical protein